MSTMQRNGFFSSRVENVKASCVREIMARMGNAGIISFAAGLPNPELFPAAAIAEAACAVLAEDAADALQYCSTEGYPPLREWIVEHLLRPQGIQATADEVLLVNGSQQALDLIGKALLDPGDIVLMERPAYMSAIQAFDLSGARYVSAPMNADGIDIEEAARQLEQNEVRLAYAVPTFHNPTGLCYSWEVKERFVDLLDQHGTLLVEDEPYRELRYDGYEPQSLTSLRRQRTVLLGTFSKVLAPGVRLGWVYAEKEIIRKLALAKQASDLCSSSFTQRLLHRYLATRDIKAHIDSLCWCYRQRRDSMLELLASHMPDNTTWTQPEGGMFIWATLPENIDATLLLERTVARGVAFAPGESFYTEAACKNTMRLNFTHADRNSMEKGIGIIAEEIWRMMLDAKP